MGVPKGFPGTQEAGLSAAQEAGLSAAQADRFSCFQMFIENGCSRF